jgi:pheromone a factor receptor
MTIDLLITVGLPVLQMVARKYFILSPHHQSNPVRVPEYVASGHRFNIVEDYGCGPATYNTPLAFVLVWSWPLIIALVSASYGGRF